jgi:hypothetical protein
MIELTPPTRMLGSFGRLFHALLFDWGASRAAVEAGQVIEKPAAPSALVASSVAPSPLIRRRGNYPTQRDRVIEHAAMAREMYRL